MGLSLPGPAGLEGLNSSRLALPCSHQRKGCDRRQEKLSTKAEATAATLSRSRQKQMSQAGVDGTVRPRLEYQSLHSSASQQLLPVFLEYGVCREQYFTEVTLRDELASEARFVAEVLEGRPALTGDLPAVEERTANGAAPAMDRLERAFSGSSEESWDRRAAASAKPERRASLREEWQLSGYWRRSSREVTHAVESRRKARKARWAQMAAAGAAAGVEAGAFALAAKRRARNRRARAGTDGACGGQTTSRYSHPMLQSIQRQATGKGAQRDLDSALNMMLGQPVRLLTRQEELELVDQMQAGLQIQAAIEELQAREGRQPTPAELTAAMGVPLDTISERLTLGLKAKHTLMHANKRLVFKLAHMFGHDTRVPYEEYVLAGMEGLLKGLLKFDPRRGHKLSSMLVWWIRCDVSNVSRCCAGVLQVPRHLTDLSHRVQRTRRRMADSLGRTPSEAELRRKLGVTREQLAKVLHLEASTIRPMEDEIGSAGDAGGRGFESGSSMRLTHGEVLLSGCGSLPTPEEVGLGWSLEELLACLTPKQAAAMRLLYGTHHPHGSRKLQREVAKEWGVTTKRIGQIRLESLQLLRERHSEDVLRSHLTGA